MHSDVLVELVSSGQIFSLFTAKEVEALPSVPLIFDGGYAQYFEIWQRLFIYELQSLLVMSGRDTSQKIRQNSGQRSFPKSRWTAYARRGKEQTNYLCSMRLYDRVKTPKLSNIFESMVGVTKESFFFKNVKKQDLLLLSTEKLDFMELRPSSRKKIKTPVSKQFMSHLLSLEGVFFAFVTKNTNG